jgi:addiction module HigA family antidote
MKTKIAKPGLNPAAGVIEEMIEHLGITKLKASEALGISAGFLSGVLNNKRPVSAELAIRSELCFGVPADYLMRLQAEHDYRVAYHQKREKLEGEIVSLV